MLFDLLAAGARDCASAKCGPDAGCRRQPDATWICICPHDLSVRPPHGSCPRSVGKSPISQNQIDN